MKKYPLISDLNDGQKSHMAWRADRYTGYGLGAIQRLMIGRYGDMRINEAFLKLEMKPHQAKWHAAAVAKYDPKTYKIIKS